MFPRLLVSTNLNLPPHSRRAPASRGRRVTVVWGANWNTASCVKGGRNTGAEMCLSRRVHSKAVALLCRVHRSAQQAANPPQFEVRFFPSFCFEES